MHWTQRPTWTVLACSGLGGLAALALTQDWLAQGGLLLIAVAVGVGALIGLPVTFAEGRSDASVDHPAIVLRGSLVQVWTVVAVGAAIASMGVPTTWLTILLIVLAWAGSALGGWPARAAAGALVVTAVAVAGASFIGGAVGGLTDTLLEPPDSVGVATIFGVAIPWVRWLGLAIVVGFVLSGAGLSSPARAHAARPWAAATVIGAGGLLLLGSATALAQMYELTGTVGATTGVLASVLFYLLAAAAPLAAGLGQGRARMGLASIGLASTFVFLGPAHDALPLWWLGVFPLGIAISLGLLAMRSRGRTALTLWVGALLISLAPILAWPELPGPLAAGLVALAPVVAVWVAGTVVLRRRAA